MGSEINYWNIVIYYSKKHNIAPICTDILYLNSTLLCNDTKFPVFNPMSGKEFLWMANGNYSENVCNSREVSEVCCIKPTSTGTKYYYFAQH